MSGEEGQEFKVGKSVANKPLNRFRNITPCEFKHDINYNIIV